MNIGIYNPQVGTIQSGGTETFIREIISCLADSHSIVVYTGKGEFVDDFPDAVHTRVAPFISRNSRLNQLISLRTGLPPFLLESFSFYFNARRRGLFSKMVNEVDVYSTHHFLDNILASRTLSLPNLFHFPGINESTLQFKIMKSVANTDLYLANSDETRRRAEGCLDIDIAGVVYPGVEYKRFSPEATPAFTHENPIILYVGRLDRGKGLNDLIDAHASMEEEAELYLVGEGELKDPLEKRVSEVETNKKVHFVGSVSHEILHRYYVACDIFCLPSYHESFGMVNIEAAASGSPIVSSSLPVVEEYIDHGRNGLLFEPGNVAELTHIFDRLIRSPKLRTKLGKNARQTAKEFSWASQANKLEQYFSLLIRNNQ